LNENLHQEKPYNIIFLTCSCEQTVSVRHFNRHMRKKFCFYLQHENNGFLKMSSTAG
jgi:hypothetical protein